MIDWKAKALAYKSAYLNDLKKLVAIDSERDEDHKTSSYPLGSGPAKALKQYLSFGKRDGFKVKNLGNIVGYIEYGSGDQTLAILAHADVMPAGKGWKTNPFKMIIDNDEVFGRGTSDDKGPGLAAYYGLRMLKDAGITPNYKIRFIIGTDEESNWLGMKHYFNVEPAPDLGFSPDAEFPLINGEKGISSFKIDFNDKDNHLISFHSGLRDNMVPSDANAVIKSNDNKSLLNKFKTFINSSSIDGNAHLNNDQIKLHVKGKAAHGMLPQNGINAGTYLAHFLNQINHHNNLLIDFLDRHLYLDFFGRHLNLNYRDKVMGSLTINPGIMDYHSNHGKLIINVRYPKGIDINTIDHELIKIANNYNANVKLINNMNPHYVNPNDPIVLKLMDAYKSQTGRHDQPKVVGGGTYARMMKRGVAFGALCSWKTPSTMHQPNEFQPISDLILAMSIYGQAIYKIVAEK